MHFRETLRNLDTLTENRRAKLQYTEEKVKNVLDRVIVELQGSDSAMATRLAKEFAKVKQETDRLTEIENGLKEEAREYISDYFDAQDEALTRVLQTASLELQLSKKGVRRTEDFDLEGFHTDILRLLPDASKVINSLIKKYLDVKETDIKPKVSVKFPKNVPVKGKGVKESMLVEGNFMQNIQAFGAKFLAYVKQWSARYGQQLNAIAQKYGLGTMDANPGDQAMYAESWDALTGGDSKKNLSEEEQAVNDMAFMQRMIVRYEDGAISGITETKHYLVKYLDIAKRIDASSPNAAKDKMLERKVHSVLMKLEAVKNNLTQVTEFIKGSQ